MLFEVEKLVQFQFVREEKTEKVTNDYFNAHYGFANVPVIFKGSFKKWTPNYEQWDLDYFDQHLGKYSGIANRTVNGTVEKKDMPISDYINYMKSTADDVPFYLNTQEHNGTFFTNQYKVPDFFSCWYGSWPADNRRYDLSWLYFAAKGTFSKLHIDVWNSSAWNALIQGKKLWFFYSQLQRDLVYQGQVNPFDESKGNFPLFKYAKPLVCIQEPGDVVYTPTGWWHTVLNLEAGVSLTENFLNLTNYTNVLEELKNSKPKSYHSILKLVNHNLKKL